MLSALVDGRISRDDADRWAMTWVNAADPPEMPATIWKALLRMAGCDLRHGPGQEYLHSEKQLKEWLRELKLHEYVPTKLATVSSSRATQDKDRKNAAIAKIRLVEDVLRQWDPIGIEPSVMAPADEYDSYAPHMVSMVEGGCTVEELASHLDVLSSTTIGAGSNMKESAKFAAQIIEVLRPSNKLLERIRPFSMLDVLLDAEPLSQVVFIHDYIQLVFQDTYFNLYNRVTVHRGGCNLKSSDVGFADELRRLIGERVVDTSSEEGQFSAVKFECGTQISVSLRAEDANGPEAFELGDSKGLCVVEQNQ